MNTIISQTIMFFGWMFNASRSTHSQSIIVALNHHPIVRFTILGVTGVVYNQKVRSFETSIEPCSIGVPSLEVQDF